MVEDELGKVRLLIGCKGASSQSGNVLLAAAGDPDLSQHTGP